MILLSHLVKPVSSAPILRCQSYLQECISRRGLLHYSEGSVFGLSSTVALNCFLTQKSVSRMGRGRKRHRTSKKNTDESDHSQTGQGEVIATPPA
jgi:hypothetical protein